MAHLRPYPPHQSYHCIRSVRSNRAYINVSSQKQTRPPLMYIKTVVFLGASLRYGLCARRAMVRSSSGFKVRVEVGVILCLTAGPNRRALASDTAQVTAPFKAPQISRGRGNQVVEQLSCVCGGLAGGRRLRGAAAAAAVWVAALGCGGEAAALSTRYRVYFANSRG